MDAALWGLIGTIVGALASIGTTWMSGLHAANLQRQTASLERSERHRAFQRETLLELQDALHDSLRMMARAHIEDDASFRKNGEWGKSLLSTDVNEGVRLAARRVSILIERVADDALRSDLQSATEAMSRVAMSKSKPEADSNLARAHDAGAASMMHIGRVLRSLYEG